MLDIEKEDLTESESPDDLPALEKKYREQMRQIVTQKLDLPISALSQMLKDQIKLNPDFQRRDRWDEKRQSRLVESLLMNVPIPPVFLGEDEYGHYVVLDGRQRLTTVSRFLNNELKLRDLKIWDDLNGTTFSDLVKRGHDKYLMRRFIPAVVILKESSAVVKYDVFDRLNTGGVQAGDMEIRNAVYRGAFTDLLHEMSRTSDFCALWQIPADEIDAQENELYKTMEDLLLVLRFFALYEHAGMAVKFKDYLTEFMDARNLTYKSTPSQKVSDKERFLRAVRNCLLVFNGDAFTKPGGRRSFPLSDAVMIALADCEPGRITADVAAKIRAEVAALFLNSEFLKSIGTGTNGKGAIATRIDCARQAVQRALL